MNFKLKAMTSAVAAGLFSAPLLAQDTAPRAPSPRPPATAEQKPATPPKPVEGQIIMQSDNTVLASSLIGAAVAGYDGADTAAIKDVIIKTDGTIDGVVVGVGGFLGLGEHLIAVKWDKIKLQEDAPGKTKIVLSATKEDMKAATPFKSKAQMEADRQVELQRQQQPARPTAPTK